MKRILARLLLLVLLLPETLCAQPVREADICVYGASSAGVIAAYTAKKMGRTVILIEPGNHVGGLTSGGLGYTDIGNKYVITGLSRDFYRRVGLHYHKLEQWIFEPHVAEQIFLEYLQSARITPLYGHRIVSAKNVSGLIQTITIEASETPGPSSYQTIRARVFIDCSYEGDLMAKAGVSYFTGRESNAQYNETYNGVQLRDKHQFPDGVDPFREAGNPKSGLLWGIDSAALDSTGAADKKIQAYNFRICLTDRAANRIEIARPAGYDSSHYELLLRLLKRRPASTLEQILNINRMPNSKTDINNNGPFSTDMIGMNYAYPDADYLTRRKIQTDHEAYTKGLLYFIGHDPRMPSNLQKEMLQWGYPKDEYVDNHHWTPQMYIREARRMTGAYLMAQSNCQGKTTVQDGIGMAAYTMDAHNAQRIVKDGMVKNEGDVQIGGFGPYPVSYRAIIPKSSECRNLLVPVCLSATHIAYGSIRMEPVFMVLAQSAAVAATLALRSNAGVQEIDVSALQKILKQNPLADGSTPEILVDNDDTENVKIVGNWTRDTRECYGPSLFKDDGKSGTLKTVRFYPAITKAGHYRLYSYFPKSEQSASRTFVRVFDGSRLKDLIIKASDLRVEGQTSGEWVDLGKFNLRTGKRPYVEISNKNADGFVVADAVLFIPDFK